MTATVPPGYRWSLQPTKPEPWPNSTQYFPSQGVIGEIKPHNARGFRDGVNDLRRRRPRLGRKLQLITYRQVPGDPTRYQVLAAKRTELEAVVEGRAPIGTLRTWYDLGTIRAAKAAERIPLWECPSALGNLLEQQIRRRYATRVGAELQRKHPSTTGADIEHELLEMAEFLRELAAELEAEAGSY